MMFLLIKINIMKKYIIPRRVGLANCPIFKWNLGAAAAAAPPPVSHDYEGKYCTNHCAINMHDP
jgi:hypothetical protein